MINKKEWLKKKIVADNYGMPPTGGTYLKNSSDYSRMTRREAFKLKGLSEDQINNVYNEYIEYKREYNEKKNK
tara:strand:+ start:3131 stop:3349 length:219 start_codon:yes stop_codon:yes gene_type:complete